MKNAKELTSKKKPAKAYAGGGEIKKISLDDLKDLIDSGKAHPRVDSKTGKGISEGFYFESSGNYFQNEKDALEHAKSIGYDNLEESYEDEAHYWTEWYYDAEEMADEEEYYTEDGKLVSFEIIQSKGGSTYAEGGEISGYYSL